MRHLKEYKGSSFIICHIIQDGHFNQNLFWGLFDIAITFITMKLKWEKYQWGVCGKITIFACFCLLVLASIAIKSYSEHFFFFQNWSRMMWCTRKIWPLNLDCCRLQAIYSHIKGSIPLNYKVLKYLCKVYTFNIYVWIHPLMLVL